MADPSGLNPRSLGFRGEEILGISFFCSPAFAFKTLFVFSGILEKKIGVGWDTNRNFFQRSTTQGPPEVKGSGEGGYEAVGG